MTDVRRLVARLTAGEADARTRPCLAPCVPGGSVQVRIEGLLQTFRPDRYGWGIYHLQADGTARWSCSASPDQIERYLARLPRRRVRLAYRLQSETWLGWSLSEAVRPTPIHLVSDGQQFDVAIIRYDRGTCWFEQVDRSADPRPADLLRQALAAAQAPDALRFRALTPDMREAYGLAAEQHAGFEALRQERRLKAALALGSARLQTFEARDDTLVVTWSTAGGDVHVSAISPQDLTVISAGICLSGGDQAFDLESLPGVVEGA